MEILGTSNLINFKLAPAWPASTSRWVEPWRFGPHCKMSMKLPVGKDPNFSSVGADGQADLDWRPLKNWLKPFGRIVSYFQCRITQGAIEAVNGIIQLAKRRARGFRNFVYLRVIAYWVAGQLKANLPSYLPT